LKLTICAPGGITSGTENTHTARMSTKTTVRPNPQDLPIHLTPPPDEYFADIAAAYRVELKDLYAAGCRHVQIDDPLLAYFCAESMIAGMEARGVDPAALLDTYVRTYNACLAGRPAGLVVGLHPCRGNFKDGRHFSGGGYARIAIQLFRQIDVDAYYLEYDTLWAGTFEPLRFLPRHKSVVLGLVSSKVP
jgi:methionine synthase II (cobalamin-independent)